VQRREQLEMMLEWRDAEQAAKVDIEEAVCQRIGERGGYWPNESGKADVRKWLKKYSLHEVLTALDDSFDSYMKFIGNAPDKDAWAIAFRKIPAFLSMNQQAKEKPYLPRLLYIQGIMRKRAEEPYENYVDRLEETISRGWSVEDLEAVAKRTIDWSGMVAELNKIAEHRRGQ
jgi:hypothetical protein